MSCMAGGCELLSVLVPLLLLLPVPLELCAPLVARQRERELQCCCGVQCALAACGVGLWWDGFCCCCLCDEGQSEGRQAKPSRAAPASLPLLLPPRLPHLLLSHHPRTCNLRASEWMERLIACRWSTLLCRTCCCHLSDSLPHPRLSIACCSDSSPPFN